MDTLKRLNGRHWSILIVLVLLNWLVFSSLARFIVQSSRPGPTPTRTTKPTFTTTPTSRPPTATPTGTGTPTPTATRVLGPQPPLPTDTPAPGPPPPPAATPTQPPAPAPTPRTGRVTHTVQRGETLSSIAEQYGVNVWYIAWLNDLSDPSLIHVGQQLTIPAPGEVIPSPTPPPAQPTATSPPAPTATPPPAAPTNTPPPAPTATPAPQPTSPPASNWQFVPNGGYAGAPNLGLTRVYGTITDSAGNPVNGYRLKLNCYGNVFISYPSGPSSDPCERLGNTGWAPGFYDFTLAAQARTMDCYISVIDRPGCEGEGTPLSEEYLLHFEAPNETILIWNWLKQW